MSCLRTSGCILAQGALRVFFERFCFSSATSIKSGMSDFIREVQYTGSFITVYTFTILLKCNMYHAISVYLSQTHAHSHIYIYM